MTPSFQARFTPFVLIMGNIGYQDFSTLLAFCLCSPVDAVSRRCVRTKIISVVLLFYPGLGLALSECKQCSLYMLYLLRPIQLHFKSNQVKLRHIYFNAVTSIIGLYAQCGRGIKEKK